MACRLGSGGPRPEVLETSVLWYTEGKGDEDLHVHWFRRFCETDLQLMAPHQALRFGCRLPPSPLSYDGTLLRIRWCVRVRLFEPEQPEAMYQLPFQLVGETLPLDSPADWTASDQAADPTVRPAPRPGPQRLPRPPAGSRV